MTAEIPYIKKFKTRPAIFCKQLQLCHSELNLKLEIPEEQLSETLADIYSDATLIEVFTWISFFKTQKFNLDLNSFASSFGFHFNDTASLLLEKSSTWPESFKTWTLNKKAHIHDLRPLILTSKLSIEAQNCTEGLLNHWTSLNPSLNQGKQIIELFMDVAGLSSNSMELQNIINSFSSAPPTSDQLLKKLLKLRYPLTTQHDQKSKNYVAKSTWPAPVQVTFKRHGDKAGFDVSALVTTAKQCESVTSKLEQSLKSLAHHLAKGGLEL